MSETKFTKGQWELSLDIGGKTLIHCEGVIICEGINCMYQGDNVDPHNIEARSNANLMVTAKEMYYEIEKDISILECQLIDAETHGEVSRIQDRIITKVKLLKKARGEI